MQQRVHRNPYRTPHTHSPEHKEIVVYYPVHDIITASRCQQLYGISVYSYTLRIDFCKGWQVFFFHQVTLGRLGVFSTAPSRTSNVLKSRPAVDPLANLQFLSHPPQPRSRYVYH